MKKIIFAGGGTAGHIEPALAVAREWKKKYPESEIVFIGTTSGLEGRLVPEAGFTLRLISKVRISRSLHPSLLIVPITLIQSIMQSIRILKGANLLIGFGGYVSGPAYAAAFITRTPYIIHEANARPGIANRIGARFSRFSATCHDRASHTLRGSIRTGLPLREDVRCGFQVASTDWSRARAQAKRDLGFSEKLPLLFIFGGSQGSVAINTVIAESREFLFAKEIQVLHGVGSRNPLPESNPQYHARTYITDMATAYLAADIIISRSGAVTCAEVNTLGKFALFIPLPIGNGEQELNALDLVDRNRAEIVSQSEFTSEWLASNIDRLIQLSQKAPIAGSADDLGAATKIVDLMERAIQGEK